MSATRLYRSRDAVAGGVCAGIARRVGVDPAVTRILAVLLCFMTLGFGVILYIALWAAMPQEPESPELVDVSPREAMSETYGAIAATQCGASSERAATARSAYCPAAHEPPQPPLGARAAAAAVASGLAAGGSVLRSSSGIDWGSGSVAPSSPSDPALAAPAAKASLVSRIPRPVKAVILWACFALAFVGIMRLLGFAMEGASWWRLWPLFFSLSGISIMAVPGRRTLRMAHAVSGWALLMAGSVTLPMSLGLVRWASLVPWCLTFWPLAGVAVGCLVMGWLKRSWPWSLAAGILFTAFFVGGLVVFAQPGAVDAVAMNLPLGRQVIFSYPFN